MRFILIALCASACLGVRGAEVELFGVGARSCEEYAESRRDADPVLMAIYASWLTGYISGYNVYAGSKSPKAAGEVTVQQLLGHIDRYCGQRPASTFQAGADDLIGSLARRR